MSTPGRDPDEDVRRLLEEDGQQPGAAHDSNVLRAAREMVTAPVTAPAVRRASRTRTWALAASVTVVFVGGTLEWRALHSNRSDVGAGLPGAGLWIAPNVIEPGLTRGQKDAPRLDFPGGTMTVRLRLRTMAPVTNKAFDAELSTASGRVVHTIRDIRPIVAGDATELDVDLPALILDTGSYVLTIRSEGSSEGTSADDYAFSVAPP
jgi:hypothetical protein